jgi:voltage-gated potassium channel
VPSTESPGRAALGTAVRSATAVLLLVVAYYRAPLDRPLDVGAGIVFLGTLVLFAALVVVEVRAIIRSPRPRLRAIRTLALGLPLLLVTFAASYSIVDAQQLDAFTEPLSRTDGLYFSMTVFATVGFGDISPTTELARVLVTVQMVVDLLAVGILAKVVLGAVQVAEGRSRHAPEPAGLPRADEP